MAGMVLGVTIVDDGTRAHERPPDRRTPPRTHDADDADRGRPVRQRAGVRVRAGVGPRRPAERDDAHVSVPGPTLALRRGEPVEITLVNHLPEATSIHWHGMELESYYDGVHGWSGAGAQVTPLDRAGRVVHRALHAAACRHVHLSHAPARRTAADVGHVWRAAGARAGRDFRSRRPITSWSSGAAASAATRPPCSTDRARPQMVWKSRHAPSRALHQHHAGRHHRPCPLRQPMRRSPGACYEGRSAGARRTVRAAAVHVHDRRRRDVRLRRRRASRAAFPVDQRRTPAGRWQVQGQIIVK